MYLQSKNSVPDGKDIEKEENQNICGRKDIEGNEDRNIRNGKDIEEKDERNIRDGKDIEEKEDRNIRVGKDIKGKEDRNIHVVREIQNTEVGESLYRRDTELAGDGKDTEEADKRNKCYEKHTEGSEERHVHDKKASEKGYGERRQRYVDSNIQDTLCKSSNINAIKPYFDGKLLTQRMDKIREKITYIREHWGKYDEFNSSLKQFAEERMQSFETKELVGHIVSKRRDWVKTADEVTGDFEAIRLYTSVSGYNELLSVINLIFRHENAANQDNLTLLAVFVVELINIDLFNYCIKFRKFNNFTGIVYRGMAIPEADLQLFDSLREKEVSGRYIATPLSLVSSSVSRGVAEAFIKREIEEKHDRWPVLMKIYITELEPHYLDFYRKRFPTSVISTICAVDIKDISVLPEEKEVLLRGPFFQFLNAYNEGHLVGKPYKILEMFMLNTNRDHISTMQLGPDGAAARELFGNMVAATRYRFAIKYYEDRDLQAGAEEYRKLLREKEEKLKLLMNN